MSRAKKHYNNDQLSVLIRNLSKKLKAYREEASLSQNQLSKKANISLSTLNEIENLVASDVRLSTITEPAKALGRKPIELITDSNLQLTDPDKQDLERASNIIWKLKGKLCD